VGFFRKIGGYVLILQTGSDLLGLIADAGEYSYVSEFQIGSTPGLLSYRRGLLLQGYSQVKC
jgi:hypothetical protein